MRHRYQLLSSTRVSPSALHFWYQLQIINHTYRNVSLFLNNPETRSALGVDDAAGDFIEISMGVNHAFWASGDPLHPTQYHVAELLNRGVKVLIYAGSYDFIANWVGNLRWTLDMEWPSQEGYRAAEIVNPI